MSVLNTTTETPLRAPRGGTRIAGYAVGAVVNASLLLLVNVWPGWHAVWFLTAEFGDVLWLVNAVAVTGLLAQLVYLMMERPWLRPTGDLVVTTVGLVAAVALLRTFPFAFPGQSFDGEGLVRLLLVVGIVGSAIGIVVAFATLLTRGRRTV